MVDKTRDRPIPGTVQLALARTLLRTGLAHDRPDLVEHAKSLPALGMTSDENRHEAQRLTTEAKRIVGESAPHAERLLQHATTHAELALLQEAIKKTED
ncbi:MAG: hypothetical protein IPL88_03805 [Rhizobiales bacterium]|nr:hypothetical protein [Hyphomicrobiales bacterium]